MAKYILILSLLLSVSCRVQEDEKPTPTKDPVTVTEPVKSPDEGEVENPQPTEPTPTPNPGEETNNLKIAVLSDLNGSYGSMKYSSRVRQAVDKIISMKPDLVLITGDMVAGQKKGLNYKGMWKAFHQEVTFPLEENNIPIFVTPGNHDASAGRNFATERRIYQNEWIEYYNRSLFNNEKVRAIDYSNYPLRYAFAMGDSLFISMDSTTVSSLSRDQFNWIESLLIEFSDYKNKILFGHIPFTPFTHGRENDYIRDSGSKDFLRFKELGANLFLSGHHHGFYPGLYHGTHVVSQACLGGGPRKLIGTSSRTKYSFTWIETADEKLDINAYYYPNFDKKIPRSTLPSRIRWSKGPDVIRDDLAPLQ